MTDNIRASVQTLEPRSGARQSEARKLGDDFSLRPSAEGGFIAVIESRLFLRECLATMLRSAFSLPVITYSTVSELEHQASRASPEIIVLSLLADSNDEITRVCKILSELLPKTPIVVLGGRSDAELVRTVIAFGAKAYIPCTTRFEIAVAATRFVLAGGTYVPPEIIFEPPSLTTSIDMTSEGQSSKITSFRPSVLEKAVTTGLALAPSDHRGFDLITRRELAVIQAIHQGKSNKSIAYLLDMCESTVKVHVRNIMRKLGAKNRAHVAAKAQSLLDTVSTKRSGAVVEAAEMRPVSAGAVLDIVGMACGKVRGASDRFAQAT